MSNPVIRATFRKYHNIDQVITQFEEIIERQNTTWAFVCVLSLIIGFIFGSIVAA